MATVEETVRRRLIAEREAKGWTRTQLAEKAGMDTSSLWKMEKADPPRRITIDDLVRLCRALGISVDSVMVDKEADRAHDVVRRLYELADEINGIPTDLESKVSQALDLVLTMAWEDPSVEQIIGRKSVDRYVALLKKIMAASEKIDALSSELSKVGWEMRVASVSN